MNTIALIKPISKDGSTIAELNLDLDKITGRDIVAAEKEARLMGDTSTDLGFSKTFQAIIASKAANETVVVDDILGLSGADFMLVTNTVSNFLFGWVLSATAQQKS